MVNERSEHKAYGFLFEMFYKDLKRVNVKKLLLSAQQFLCTASTLLPRVEVCEAWGGQYDWIYGKIPFFAFCYTF